MSLSNKNIPDSTKVSDDMLALQRKRIAANSPQSDKLLASMAQKPTYQVIVKHLNDGMAILADSYKVLAVVAHDLLGHEVPFNACLSELCLVNKKQIDQAVGIIASVSEFEPERQTDAPALDALVEADQAYRKRMNAAKSPDDALVEAVKEYIDSAKSDDQMVEFNAFQKLRKALAAHEKEKSHVS